jgi:serine/threonine protein phosphatase 1
MILGLLKRRAPRLPKGERLYVIGDVHGCFDLLNELFVTIDAEQEQLPSMRTHVIFLGDLIDRGPDSRRVIDLVRWAAHHKVRVLVLKGNHEEVLIDAWRGNREALAGWLAYGGVETLISFGVDPAAIDPSDLDRMAALLHQAIPADLIAWLDALPLLWESGDYAFVHAGIRPGLPLDRQEASDLLWIRDEFLQFEGAHERVIVHGHTISPEVEIRPNRIGLDTGAYATGVLSALCLCGRDRRVIATAPRDMPGSSALQ